MRDEKSLVDVHAHAQRAAERTNGSGKLHRVFDGPQEPTSKADSHWTRFKLSLPQPEILEVAGRAVKGWAITPAMGLTLFLAFGSVFGFMYNRMSDQIVAKDKSYQEQHDLLIEIKTELRINKEH